MPKFPKTIARAARGAAFLDVAYPGWAKRVDIERLHLDSPYSCILGQVYGEFIPGIRNLGLYRYAEKIPGYQKRYNGEMPYAVAAGFFVDYNLQESFGYRRELTAAWTEEINARLAQSI